MKEGILGMVSVLILSFCILPSAARGEDKIPLKIQQVPPQQTEQVRIPGTDPSTCSVLRLKNGSMWVLDGARVFQLTGSEITRLPDLPEARFHAGLAEYRNCLFVVGGSRTAGGPPVADVFSCSLEGKPDWVKHPPLPQGGRLDPLVSEVYNELVIAGGLDSGGKPTVDVFGYSPVPREGHVDKGYEKRKDSPIPLDGKTGVVRTGQSHLLVSDGKKIAVFHDVTDTWVDLGTLGQEVLGGMWRAGSSNREWILDNGKTANSVFFDNGANRLPVWDYLVIVLYFVLVTAIGLFFSRRQKNAADFALGGQRIKWWAAAIGIMASHTSAVSFMAIPAMIGCTSLVFFGQVLFIIPGILVAAFVTYPLFRRLNLISTYEYLESRYGLSLRLMGSALAISGTIFVRLSIVILLPSLAISTLTGIPTQVSVLLIGLVTTLYSSFGGFEAVVWTDVVQGILLVVGFVVIAACAYANIPGGMHTIVSCGLEADKLRLFITKWDFALPVIWIHVAGMVFGWMTFASDQATAQRISCTPLKDVRKLSYLSGACICFISFAVACIGILLFVYFKNAPAMLDPMMQNDQVVPLFVLKKIPVGITGVIIATLFAGSMATISAGINTCAVLFGEDFMKRFKKDLSSRAELRIMQGTSLFVGLFATAMAYYLINAKTPFLSQLNVELGAMFGGAFAGVFALGMFTRRTHEIGAIVGIVCGAAVPVALKFQIIGPLHWLAWGLAGTISCMVFGYLASILIPWKRKNLTGLTIFDQLPADKQRLADAKLEAGR